MMPLEKKDHELIAEATTVIKRLYAPGKHAVGAALRTKEGKIVTAVHLEAFVGRVAVCAEAIALGKALSEGENEFTTIVAVYHPDEGEQAPRVVAPCGMCRELLLDYCPHIHFIIPTATGGYAKCAGIDLLPFKYQK